MGTWLRHIWLLLRSSYWFVPGTMLLGSVLAAWRAIRVDQLRPPPEWINSLAYAGSIEGARQVLATLASSAITVAGVAFSITVATLSQASSQFGPRILRNFMHDLGNQIVLGTFTATFTFCILVLRTVRTPSEIASFAPHFSVTCAVSLGVCSICVLIYFIHHVVLGVGIAAREIVNPWSWLLLLAQVDRAGFRGRTDQSPNAAFMIAMAPSPRLGVATATS